MTLGDFSKDVVPPAIAEIHRRLRRSKFDAFLVGGWIRDYLLGFEPKDFDTATDAKPEQIRKVLPNAFIIGRRFRLVHAPRGETTFEIATYRRVPPTNKSTQRGRRFIPDNTYGTQREDAFRRDFTINALYFDLRRHQIIDYIGGLADLDAGIIRSIGSPDERFQEDPVRILRAARFAAKLDFSLDSAVVAAMHAHKHLLRHVSRARMRDELAKLFLTGHGAASYQKMREFDLMPSVLPQHPRAIPMIEHAMVEADERVAAGHKLSTFYLFAVMLWHPYCECLAQRVGEDDNHENIAELRYQASREVFKKAREHISLNREAEQFIFSLFSLQNRLEKKRNIRRALDHPRIRAAVHLLRLRSQVGEVNPKLVAWWEERQPPRENKRKRRGNSKPKARGPRHEPRSRQIA